MKFIKLTIIALVGLLVTTTSCEKEEPTPTPPTHLGLWELQSIRTIEYYDSKIVSEKTDYIDITTDFIERLEFKDATNGVWTFIYPNNEFPQENDSFTYKIEGANLIMTYSDGDENTQYELNIQAQNLTFFEYEVGSATDPNREVRYLTYKRL
jgi:hypothetical protein